MITRFRTRSAGLTDVGQVRQVNEDALLLRDDAGVWLVADGMGGHENGEWASSVIAGRVAEVPVVGDFDADLDALGGAVLPPTPRFTPRRNRVGAHGLYGRTAAVAGRSVRRAVGWRQPRLPAPQRAATPTQPRPHASASHGGPRLYDSGEAETHPMAHVLARAVGAQATLELEAITDAVEPRDVFLLCSDGLTGLVSNKEIGERLGGFGVETACRRLMDLALARGAPDNVTVVAVACEETTILAFGPDAD
jgi:hypothetical protein